MSTTMWLIQMGAMLGGAVVALGLKFLIQWLLDND